MLILSKKLNQHKDYYNLTRGHWALDQLTSNQRADTKINRWMPKYWPIAAGGHIGMVCFIHLLPLKLPFRSTQAKIEMLQLAKTMKVHLFLIGS